MRPIPKPLLKKILSNKYYKRCSRSNHDCDGRITLEHSFIYAGRQINEEWAIIPLCWYHHLGDGLDKHENERISLSRASDEDLSKYPRTDWKQKKKYYGIN